MADVVTLARLARPASSSALVCGKPGWLGAAGDPGVLYCESHVPNWSEEMREAFRRALAGHCNES
jgi:hypothetical protein